LFYLVLKVNTLIFKKVPDLFAQFWNVIAILEAEFGHWNSSSQFPVIAGRIESLWQVFNQRQEAAPQLHGTTRPNTFDDGPSTAWKKNAIVV
jgi:hypothetical protein